MNETIKNLLERRSVRGYKEDLVPEEVLNEILKAGEYAEAFRFIRRRIEPSTPPKELEISAFGGVFS